MRKINFIILLCLFTITVNAQVSVSSSAPEPNSKWVYGGNAGAGFVGGNGLTIYATPSLGYKLTNDLIGGIDGNFSWRKTDYSRSIIFGAGPFLRYFIGRHFYASANYRHYFINQKIKDTGTKYSENEATLNLGAGYLQPLGANAYLKVGANYNVLYKKNKSVMGSPFVPYIGVVFGL